MTSRKEERKGLGEKGREGKNRKIISGFASEDLGPGGSHPVLSHFLSKSSLV